MNVVTGDLLRLALDGRFDVIVRGCNCQCAMGKGIALSMRGARVELCVDAQERQEGEIRGGEANAVKC